MGDSTGISWTDATWNCIRGCTEVSPGCARCYAREQAARIVRMDAARRATDPTCKAGSYDRVVQIRHGKARWTDVVEFDAAKLADPLRWRKPRRIFVNSMSDLFHEKLTNEQIAAVFGVMAACPQHTFQVLTKRAKRMREWFEWIESTADINGTMHVEAGPHLADSIGNDDAEYEEDCPAIQAGHRICDAEWPLPNVWLGVSVENQDAADERIPDLLATPAAVRFLSCEPLLGEVDLDTPRCDDVHHGDAEWGLADDEATPWCIECDEERSYGHWLHLDGGIDWVIAGCESGPGARPCDVAWLRSLRDQCANAEVPFFLKQAVETYIGYCGDANNPNGARPCGKRVAAFVISPSTAAYSCGCTVEGAEDGACVDLGFGDGSKRKPGGVIELPYLDGVQWAQFPEVP